MSHTPQAQATGRYAAVNGLNMYYEVHGAGQPLILIHGGFGMVGMFAAPLPALAETRQVIAVELQGHGHTADIDRPLSFELLADDIAALIRHLGLEQADVLGYSLGGGVALQTAIRHPELVRRLVVISAPHKRDGWYPEVLAGMASVTVDTMSGSMIHDAYLSAAPNPHDWPRLVDKTRELLGRPYDWSEGLAASTTPTLIVIGDADSVAPAQAVEMFALLGGGQRDGGWDRSGVVSAQLAVLPGTTHFTVVERVDLLLPIITSFLDAPLAERA